jgi:hypothetical protein
MTHHDLGPQLLEQLTWHWDHHLRPRLDGLTDEEYHREPVEGSWGLRPRGGGWAPDFALPEPVPPPVTTIAWRLAHVVVGIFGERNHSHFGGPEISYDGFAYAGTADEALAQLDEGYARWVEGVRSLTPERLWSPVGPAEGPFAEHPYAALVLHIHREVIHHGAEVLLLRDLFRSR